MQLIVDIKNDSIADKIVWLLKSFEDKGVKIIETDISKSTPSKILEEYTYKDQQKLANSDVKDLSHLMTNEDPTIDDDEVLPEAYWEYNSDKYSN